MEALREQKGFEGSFVGTPHISQCAGIMQVDVIQNGAENWQFAIGQGNMRLNFEIPEQFIDGDDTSFAVSIRPFIL